MTERATCGRTTRAEARDRAAEEAIRGQRALRPLVAGEAFDRTDTLRRMAIALDALQQIARFMESAASADTAGIEKPGADTPAPGGETDPVSGSYHRRDNMAELSPAQTSQRYWLAFTGKTSEAEARAAFKAR